jgi:hypothetical protein
MIDYPVLRMSAVGQNPNLPHRNTDARFTSISRPQQGGFNATLCARLT